MTQPSAPSPATIRLVLVDEAPEPRVVYQVPLVERATAGFEAWDYTRSLEATETFFWSFSFDRGS